MRVLRGPGWLVAFGPWWALQVALDGTISLGVHVDPRIRRAPQGAYGPYLDVHAGPLVASIGRHPARAADLLALAGASAIARPDR